MFYKGDLSASELPIHSFFVLIFIPSVCCARHKGVSEEETGPALLGSGGSSTVDVKY